MVARRFRSALADPSSVEVIGDPVTTLAGYLALV